MMLRIIYVVLIALCAQQALIRSATAATAAEQGSLVGQPTGTLGLTPLGLAFSVDRLIERLDQAGAAPQPVAVR